MTTPDPAAAHALPYHLFWQSDEHCLRQRAGRDIDLDFTGKASMPNSEIVWSFASIWASLSDGCDKFSAYDPKISGGVAQR